MIDIKSLDLLSQRYQSAVPFPHVVIDDFLPVDLATRLAGDFPVMEEMSKIFREPMSYKGQTSDIAHKAPSFEPTFADLQSPEFLGKISRITGIANLLPDAVLAGGGLHQSPNSGFLDLHVDANFHPFDKTMHRRVNILIYLNPEWKDEWGGNLELWSDRNRRPAKLIRSVTPIFNRLVIFSTTRTSWHGVSAINCPDGYSRKSMALYYYTHERPADEIYTDSSVIWQNPNNPWKRVFYPAMNFGIAVLKPYAKRLRRRDAFDAVQ
jgi:Rps23 Pro-64 3,4-dihydroxylase Tpa1-like proline 4-hydroxylase